MLPSPQARPGFTIIEILAALVILSVALTGAAVMMTGAFGTYRSQDRTLERHRLVHDQLEGFTATPYGDLKRHITNARRPEDPPRDGMPPEIDYQSVSGGEAIVRYEIEPPAKPGEDWKPLPRVKPGAEPLRGTADGPKPMEATVRLQFWDPEFDSPVLNDSGLIRATFTVGGQGAKDQAVKYLAR